METFNFRRVLFLFAISWLVEIAVTQNLSLAGDVKLTSTEASPKTNPKEDTDAIVKKWETFDQNFKSVINQAIKRLLPVLMQRSGNLNVSSTCTGDILRFIGGLRSSKVWAFSILDATGKEFDGLLSGNLATLGEYDQCVKTEATDDRRGRNYGKVLFRGKYCALDLRPPLPPKKPFYRIDEALDELKNFSKQGTVAAEIAKIAHFFYFLALRIGICVPSGCSGQDISNYLQNAVEDWGWSITVKRCEVKENLKITPAMMTVGAIYGFFALLLIIGTVVDLIYYYKDKKIQGTGIKVLTSFSFVSNFRKLVSTSSSCEELTCLNGVRVLSITWIILGHSYKTFNFQILNGYRKAITYQKDFEFQAIMNASVAADSFFFTGGLLLCYLTMKMVKEMKQPLSLVYYVFHRIWRIIPLYAAVILFMLLVPSMSSGPIWHDTIDHHVDACHKNWWTNLVFLNNYLHAENMCLPHSWYIACDMQLYLFSLVILLPLLRWPKIGICLAVLCVIASMIATSSITYINNFPPTLLFMQPDIDHIRHQVIAYFKPYPHAAPYCIGILVGYLLATKPKIRFSRMVLTFGWCAAIICNLSVLYGTLSWNKGRDPILGETIFYTGCYRTVWALGLAWVVFCCATEQGGVARYILTWEAWIPISRLTYSAYLIHYVMQIIFIGTLRVKFHPYHDLVVWMYFGHLMLSYAVAFVLSMLFEAPLLGLEKIFLKKNQSLEDATNSKAYMTPTVLTNAHTKESVDSKEANLSNGNQNIEVCRL